MILMAIGRRERFIINDVIGILNIYLIARIITTMLNCFRLELQNLVSRLILSIWS